jgi:predicted acetyltransferase
MAGFALVNQLQSSSTSEPFFDLAEFFVLPAFRRQGTGTMAAHLVWAQFPGAWQVRVLEANHRAVGFWNSAIRQFTGSQPSSEPFSIGDEAWRRFYFRSHPAP